MPLTAFTHQIGNPSATRPASLIVSLSAAGNNIITLGTNANGTEPVKFIAFNGLAAGSLTGTLATLSAFPGTQFRVDRAYTGRTFAIVYENNTSSLFTCLTSTTVQSLTANNFQTIVPEMKRLWNLTND